MQESFLRDGPSYPVTIEYPPVTRVDLTSPPQIFDPITRMNLTSPLLMPQPRVVDSRSYNPTKTVILEREPIRQQVIELEVDKKILNDIEDIIAPTSTKVSIYNQMSHAIKNYPEGIHHVHLPKSVHVDSIIITGPQGEVIPFHYISNIPLIDSKVVTVKQGKEFLTGKLLSINGDDVSILINNKTVLIRNYDQIMGDEGHGHAHPMIELHDHHHHALSVSYLFDDLKWRSKAIGLIDPQRNTITFRLSALITNNSDEYITADTTLVSGNLNRKRSGKDVSIYPSALAKNIVIESGQSSVEDYTRYDIGRNQLNREIIVNLGNWTSPVVKVYVHNTETKNLIQYGFRFNAVDHIPDSIIDVYSLNNRKEIDYYLGSDEIKESQVGEEIDIIIGESTKVRATTEIIPRDTVDIALTERYNLLGQEIVEADILEGNPRAKREWHIITERLKVDIANHNNYEINFVLKHYVGDKPLLNISCQTFKRRKNGYIEWYFKVPVYAKNEKFECEVLTAIYY